MSLAIEDSSSLTLTSNMKLLSIDIETTGLCPRSCSVLEVGAVIFDPQPVKSDANSVRIEHTRPATFECLIKHSQIIGEPYAIQMNNEIIQELAGVKETHRQILTASQFTHHFGQWIVQNIGTDQKIHPCGKNYGSFDQQFLQKMPGWDALVKPHLDFRSLDVGSLYFSPDDGKILGLPKCLEKIGCPGLVTHRALDDALAVMTAITRFFN